MKNLLNKWNDLNLRYKLFTTTSILAVLLTVTILGILYIMLPPMYQNNRESKIDAMLQNVVYELDGKTVGAAEKKLEELTSGNVVYVKLQDPNGKVVYERNRFLIKMDLYKGVNLSKERINIVRDVNIKNSDKPYRLTTSFIFYPLEDTANSIREIMPFVFIIIIIISFFGSYIFSALITRPLVNIINREKYQITRKREFIGAISHELKTPITIISGQLEGMMYGIGKFKDRDLYLEKCYETTQELRTLVDKMIEISKKDILDNEVERTEVYIDDVVNETLKRYKFLFEQKSINVKTDIQSRCRIFANYGDMSTVVSNIISNAIKYSPEKNTIIVTLTKFRDKSGKTMVKLTVENTGVVLAKKELEKIFDPLYRVESSRNRKTGGSGLGLYFVSQVLDNHGFKYKMFCRENSTVFTIEFDSYNL